MVMGGSVRSVVQATTSLSHSENAWSLVEPASLLRSVVVDMKMLEDTFLQSFGDTTATIASIDRTQALPEGPMRWRATTQA
jgi:hypothetical protein